MRGSRLWQGAVLAVLLLPLGGCHGKKLVSTRGVVTLDGTPLDQAVVQFYPEAEQGEPARGVTRDDGTFELSTDRVKGVRPGTYRVVVVKMDTSGRTHAKRSLLPAVYASKETTPFTFSVPHDGPVVLDLSASAEASPEAK
jgi:hypothetical protein